VSRGSPYAGPIRKARERARRDGILAAGVALFGTVGDGAATVGAVCEPAGLNKPYSSESFATPGGLLCEVYERGVADIRAAVLAGGGGGTETLTGGGRAAPEANAGDGNTGPEVLRGFIAAFLDWAQANPVEAKVHLFEVLGVSSRVDELYRSYARSIGEEL